MFFIALLKVIFFHDKKELARERASPGPGTKWWDKVFWVFNVILPISVVIIGPLDTGRYLWSPELAWYYYVLGYLLFAFSVTMFTWAMWVNTWFSSTVRLQKDRKQQVCQAGPYKYVRHPGYTGGIFLTASMALMLGSLYSLIPGVLYSIALIIRTYLEDLTLQKELKGYKQYANKVKYRLIPKIW